MDFSILPTTECSHNCEYCLLDKSQFKAISEDEMCRRLRAVFKAIEKLDDAGHIEILLNDVPINKSEKLRQEILSHKDKINVITMNDFEADFGSINVQRHALTLDEINTIKGYKVFVITEDNWQDLKGPYPADTIFIIDSSLVNRELIKEIDRRIPRNLLITRTLTCKNYDHLYDLVLDLGLITASCSAKKTHICGHIDFEKEELVFDNKLCDVHCIYEQTIEGGL